MSDYLADIEIAYEACSGRLESVIGIIREMERIAEGDGVETPPSE